jgi:hypothetical protein
MATSQPSMVSLVMEVPRKTLKSGGRAPAP